VTPSIDDSDGFRPQARQARERRASAAVRAAYKTYLDWQGEWDGKDGGDVSTFLDYVAEELDGHPLTERETLDTRRGAKGRVL
jgi:hypothetical protein